MKPSICIKCGQPIETFFRCTGEGSGTICPSCKKQPDSVPTLPKPQQGADIGIQIDLEGKEYIHESKPTGEIIKPSLFDWQRDNENLNKLQRGF